jgi:DNA-binding PucR family transcriptional regulator
MASDPKLASGICERSQMPRGSTIELKMVAHVDVDGVPSAVKELATELLQSTSELGTGMADHLYATMPELAGNADVELRQETVASCEANIDQVLRLLRVGAGTDAVVVPREVTDFVRSFVRRGIALPVLLRSYRLGHAWLWERWWQELQLRTTDPAELLAAEDPSSAFMFAYVDRMSDVLVEEFGSERERLVRSAVQLRAETVRAILGGDAVNEDVAGVRLGYELRREHVALRLWGGASEVRGLERAAAEAAAALGTSAPLVVPSGAASVDAWCGSYDPIAADALDGYEPPAGIRVAYGNAAYGVTGFRSSHAQALQAARVVALARGAGTTVTGYRDVELVSLLASDLPRARVFVAGQLGPLASTAEPAARLRATLLAYLEAGGSAKRVAKELYVHQNTVTYRVKRAEELLGRRVSDSSVELTCALTLAAMLGAAVLVNDGEQPSP